jgi:hypothetical protein
MSDRSGLGMRPPVAGDQSTQPRRDAEPHRGRLLLVLATFGLYFELLCVLSVIPGGFAILLDSHDGFYSLIGLPLCIVGLALVVVTRVLAVKDLALIESGHVDSKGATDTADAASVFYYGVALCVVWLVLAGACWLAF